MKTIQKIIPLLLLVSILTGCVTATPTEISAPVPTTAPSIYQGTDGFPWWNDTVFYEIFVRSFRDSDGDGVGDFNGITEKLDYLQGLGIKGLWLMPIFPSPSYHGYDVTDYYAVNPDYGTMDDFKHLLEEAHKRDIKIILDLVLNHTSSKHPWFQQALTPGSPYRDWYKWSETDPNTSGPWGSKAWYRASNGQYYYAIFWEGMPDLNYDNEAVQDEVLKITSFWLADVGVDGFRLDAIRYLQEGDNRLQDSPGTHLFLSKWGDHYRNVNPNAFTVGEIWTDNLTVSTYTKTDHELDSGFNFDLSNAMFKALNGGNNALLNFVIISMTKLFPQQENSNFIANHDMNRTMSQFVGENKEQKAKVAASLLFTLPGVPFIYYGEEIGMSGAKPDELIRTPMPWDNTQGAGFTSGKPWESANADFAFVNVALQTGQSDSLLETYRRLIQLRNEHPALRVGETFPVKTTSSKLIPYLRVDQDEVFLIVVNIDDMPAKNYSLKLEKGPLAGTYNATSVLDSSVIASLQANATGGFDEYVPLDEVPPFGIFIVQLTK